VIGTFWSPDLGWLLAEVMLAGIMGATLVSELGSKFRLTRTCYGWLAAYLRRGAAMTRQLISDGYQAAKTIFRGWPNLRADGCFLEDAG
jgi:hypothetical protein